MKKQILFLGLILFLVFFGKEAQALTNYRHYNRYNNYYNRGQLNRPYFPTYNNPIWYNRSNFQRYNNFPYNRRSYLTGFSPSVTTNYAFSNNPYSTSSTSIGQKIKNFFNPSYDTVYDPYLNSNNNFGYTTIFNSNSALPYNYQNYGLNNNFYDNTPDANMGVKIHIID